MSAKITTMRNRVTVTLTPEKLEWLRMQADWQLKEMGYDPAHITNLLQEKDDCHRRTALVDAYPDLVRECSSLLPKDRRALIEILKTTLE